MNIGRITHSVVAATRTESARTLAGPPPMPSSASLGDIQGLLAQMQVGRRIVQSQAACASASSAKAEREHKLTEAREAIAAAEEAQREAEEKKGIMDTLEVVATVAAAVVAVAAVVCTAGASTPAIVALVGVAISMSAKPAAEVTGSKWVGLGCTVAGAALSCGAGFANAGAAAAQTANAASAGTAAGAGMAEGGVGLAVRAAQVGGKLLVGTARVGQGIMMIKVGQAQKQADDLSADAKETKAQGVRATQNQDDAIELLKEIESSNQRAMSIILRTASESIATRELITSNIGRRM